MAKMTDFPVQGVPNEKESLPLPEMGQAPPYYVPPMGQEPPNYMPPMGQVPPNSMPQTGQVPLNTIPLGPQPCMVTCPSCSSSVLTVVQTEPGMQTHLMALLLCL